MVHMWVLASLRMVQKYCTEYLVKAKLSWPNLCQHNSELELRQGHRALAASGSSGAEKPAGFWGGCPPCSLIAPKWSDSVCRVVWLGHRWGGVG